MDSNFLKNVKQELGRRAELSLTGKAIIGIAGAIILLIVAGLKTCNKRDDVELETSNVKWLNQSILDLATSLDSLKRTTHFIKFGINTEIADSVGFLVYTRNKGGVVVHELNKERIDSLNKVNDFSVPTGDSNYIVFYIQSLDKDDYIIVVEDSLIKNIIDIPER